MHIQKQFIFERITELATEALSDFLLAKVEINNQKYGAKMNKQLKQVLEWQKLFGRLGHIVADDPICIDEKTMTDRLDFMYEELREYSVANSTNDLKGILDALIDLQYFLYGMVVIHGLQDVFDREFAKVHQANMAKLWPDGKVHFSDNGKVLKPKGWQHPVLNVKNEL